MVTWSLFLLALAVSIDGFTVGFTYGMRKVSIPIRSLLVISSCSFITLLAAMGIGKIINHLFSPAFAKMIGGTLLIILGLWIIVQFFFKKEEKEEKLLINVEIRSLGIVIHILRKPTIADFDRSGTITGIEAVFLGLALSLDAFGAGVSAALLNYSLLSTASLVALLSFCFLLSGLKAGKAFAKYAWLQKYSFLPGILLILIGIFKLK
ncbi:sporulation membrane protein YtaF [Thermolongibacillus altinsuensis]|uniref:sporulation membrane protein YtaF n=1 Tax=Thermolongibacillus altinsuensis TaxID=575256 RepID=UPI00242A3174|nr:sporulation membrane protein YtaF [Thermolongibacillus altinsuensis]GMB07369.1 sporulation membrane protein YtaF [Thermolongibacillus altinsuensis]